MVTSTRTAAAKKGKVQAKKSGTKNRTSQKSSSLIVAMIADRGAVDWPTVRDAEMLYEEDAMTDAVWR